MLKNSFWNGKYNQFKVKLKLTEFTFLTDTVVVAEFHFFNFLYAKILSTTLVYAWPHLPVEHWSPTWLQLIAVTIMEASTQRYNNWFHLNFNASW